jgi:NTE family protein
VPYWDGGYLGNPSLTPLLDHAQDLLLVLVNAFHRDGMPPHTAPAIMDRLNEITFNASVVLEVNAIEAINSLLAELEASGVAYTGRYKTVRLHAIRNDKFVEQLGFVSKNSTSWGFLSELRDAGYRTADTWVGRYLGNVGKRSSVNVKAELTGVVLNAPVR